MSNNKIFSFLKKIGKEDPYKWRDYYIYEDWIIKILAISKLI